MGDIQLLRAEDHRHMKWKNGAGETLEVAITPPGASPDDFDWRVSMATVAADGPFSSFAGVDRTLVVLDGDGLILDIDGRSHRLNAGDPPLAFPADTPTTATLTEHMIADLNVMTRRGRFAHLVEQIDAPQDVTIADGAIVFLLGDGLAIETETGSAELGYRDCARIDGPADVHVGKAHDGAAYLIRIWRRLV